MFKKLSLIISLSFILSHTALAGRSCDEKTQEGQVIEKAVETASSVESLLNQLNPKVILIARVGQDLSKYNLKYSHIAFAYKENNTWKVFHELNKCGTATSDLYTEGLGNFFLDDMFKYDSELFIPSPMLQEKLFNYLTKDVQSIKDLHGLNYNMLAYPFSTKYQNSNQWILEVLAKSLANEISINNREQAQSWLKLKNYQPNTLEIDAMTRLGARMFKANIAFDDQPFDRRMQGHIDTITVNSVIQFISDNDPNGKLIEVNSN
jgi:hypothetical protein